MNKISTLVLRSADVAGGDDEMKPPTAQMPERWLLLKRHSLRMKTFLLISTVFVQLLFWDTQCFAQTKTFKLIRKAKYIPGDIDTTEIKRRNEPLKALAAFYSAMGGTMCDGENCELTTALGLGKQGSELHKSLIEKYFPNDKVAKAILAQHCYLRPSGASSFSDYNYLTISFSTDTAKVSYTLSYYNRGESSSTKGTDVYFLKNNVFKMVKRKLWAWADK